jgi:hypothetical protein
MAIFTIEHVSPDDLPSAWRALLPDDMQSPMTIRIEAETVSALEADADPLDSETSLTANPLFGMWQDRADVALYARQIRAPRLGPDGTRNEG